MFNTVFIPLYRLAETNLKLGRRDGRVSCHRGLDRGRTRLISPPFMAKSRKPANKALPSFACAEKAATRTCRSSRCSSAAAPLGGGLAANPAEPEASASGSSASAGRRQTRASIARVSGAEEPPEEPSADTREATRAAMAAQVCR